MKKNILYKIKKVFESKKKSKYSIIDIMLEGGAGGHMMHPYDDNELTLQEIKEIIKDMKVFLEA